MHSPDLSQENIARIRTLFPGCVTEAFDQATGQLRLAVDFDQLRHELGDHVAEGPQERYRLEWPGKREALALANAPIAKTLRPVREASVKFDSTRNLFIEGDNLDALKLLQKTYRGKIKLVYIDPPYNTGAEFIYGDDFSENARDYRARSKHGSDDRNGLVDTAPNGRFHSNWLSMMYARLKLARNLLAEDGAIFISIDDNEQANLRTICDEIFGEDNFVNCISVKLSEATGVKMSHARSRFPKTKEYILFYTRSGISKINPVHIPIEKWNDEYKELILGLDRDQLAVVKDLIYRSACVEDDVQRLNALVSTARISTLSSYFKEEGVTDDDEKDRFKWDNAWRIVQAVGAGSLRTRALAARIAGQSISAVLSAKGRLSLFKTDFDAESRDPRIRILFADKYLTVNPGDFWSDIKTSGGVALEGGISFPNGKKPLKLIKRIVNAVTSPAANDLVMDFFAGSGTTMHAVLALNAEDGGNRSCISVQIREPADERSEAYKDGFRFISDISRERMRRAGRDLTDNDSHPDWNRDVGFRVLRVDSANIEDICHHPDNPEQDVRLDRLDNVQAGRTAEDLLFQVLANWGGDLAATIANETILGKSVFFVNRSSHAGPDLMACFDSVITEELARALAEHQPLTVAFRTSAFASDAVKINVEQIFHELSPSTEMLAI